MKMHNDDPVHLNMMFLLTCNIFLRFAFRQLSVHLMASRFNGLLHQFVFRESRKRFPTLTIIDEQPVDPSIIVIPPESKRVVPNSLPSHLPEELAPVVSQFLSRFETFAVDVLSMRE